MGILTRIAALLAAAGVVVVAAGCNTIEGAGRDIKAGGAAIERSAEQSKRY